MYRIRSSIPFLRIARKFFKKHSELKSRFKTVLQIMEEDPFHPSLKLHNLEGTLKEFMAARLSYDYRIILTLRVSKKEITLFHIGTDDDVYRK